MHRKSSDSASVRLSKSLSWLLRHGAEKEGLSFLPGGFLYVDSILEKAQFSKFTVDDVQSVVATNDKQRFHLETETLTGRLKIRANQGHSLQVTDLELEPVTSPEELPVVLHGTYFKFWESIRAQGLKRMKRTHIHFAPGEPKDGGVISGMRGSCDLMIYLDLKKALADGLKFFRSANNVILTEGDQDGCVLPVYFKRVVNRKTGEELSFERDSRPQESLSETTDVSRQSSTPSSSAVSAEELADLMDSKKQRRKKKKAAAVDSA